MFRSTIKKCHKITWKMTERHMTTKESIAEKVAAMSHQEMVKNTVHVSEWNKRLLVFAGRYKTMAEIPDTLPFATVDKARNWVRVRVCNIMIVFALIGCVGMAMKGKQESEEGVSVTSMNLDWHREYNKQHAQQENK